MNRNRPEQRLRFLQHLFIVALATLPVGRATAQQVGECWRLRAEHPAGVPLHSESRNSFTGTRLPDQGTVQILEVANENRWFRVRLTPTEGWIVRTYLDVAVPCTTPPPPSPVSSIVVGTWNIECLKDGASRGFPEYKTLEEKLPPRSDADYATLAEIITSLDAKLLVLEEINGFDPAAEAPDDAVSRSHELDRLVSKLAPRQFAYVIASSGSSSEDKRIAFLYDEDWLQLGWYCRASLPNEDVQGKPLFDRQPLLGYFKIFTDGTERNDFVVVGVHLASGQPLAKNHDKAMKRITDWIASERSTTGCIPPGEFDVLIAGDFNAGRFDQYDETFWTTMESGDWDVLADDPSYPSTRLAGKPPGSTVSQIDYVIVSKGTGGLAGDEITQTTATVHTALVAQHGGGLQFRTKASDHLPVTVTLSVTQDND